MEKIAIHIADPKGFPLSPSGLNRVDLFDEVEVTPTGHSRSCIALAHLESVPGCHEDERGVLLAIMFHVGRSSWAIETEYMSIQRATTYTFGPLPDMVRAFNKMAGITLPEIRVIDPGVGIKSARGEMLSNPWKLEDGHIYEVETNYRGRVKFEARCRPGEEDRFQFLSDDNQPLVTGEYRGWRSPRIELSIPAWNSMRNLTAEANAMTDAAGEETAPDLAPAGPNA